MHDESRPGKLAHSRCPHDRRQQHHDGIRHRRIESTAVLSTGLVAVIQCPEHPLTRLNQHAKSASQMFRMCEGLKLARPGWSPFAKQINFRCVSQDLCEEL